MLRARLTACSFLLGSILILSSCGSGGKKEVKETPQATATVEVSIGGMTCTGCENTIQTNLMKVPGVTGVTASFTAGSAIVEYNPALVDSLKLKEAVNGCGYTAIKVMPHQANTVN